MADVDPRTWATSPTRAWAVVCVLPTAGVASAVVRRPHRPETAHRARRPGVADRRAATAVGQPAVPPAVLSAPGHPRRRALAAGIDRARRRPSAPSGDGAAKVAGERGDRARRRRTARGRAATRSVTASRRPGHGRSCCTTRATTASDDDQDAEGDEPGQPGAAEVHDEHGARRRRRRAPTPDADEQRRGDDPDAGGDPAACDRGRGPRAIANRAPVHGGSGRCRRRSSTARAMQAEHGRGTVRTRAMVSGRLRRPAASRRRPGRRAAGSTSR